MAALMISAGCLDQGAPPVPVADLPWPGPPARLPACEPLLPGLAPPVLPEPTGLVVIDVDALAPTGAAVAVDLAVLDPDTLTVDPGAAGDLVLDLGGAGEISSQTAVADGRARALVRFEGEGERIISVELAGDGRAGTAAVLVYTPKIPIWELEVSEADFAALLVDPAAEVWVPAAITIDGRRHPGELRLHGGSSRDFPKKSLRFNLDDGVTEARQRKLILRAEWADKTMLRNWLAFALYREVSWLPAPGSELVHLRMRGEFYGLMNHVDRIDPDLLLARGLALGGSLYEADPPLGMTANLTSTEDVEVAYQQHAGASGFDDLVDLIELLTPIDPELAGEVAIDDVLVYLAILAVFQNQDHINKNYYLYRDPEAGGWQIIPWDLDLTFGHLYSEEATVLGEDIVADGHPYAGVAAAATGLENGLIDRLLDHPERSARYLAILDHLLDTITDERVAALLDHGLCLAGPEIVADPNRRAELEEIVPRVGEIRTFLLQRRAYLEGWTAGAAR